MFDIFMLLICALFIGFLGAEVFALVKWRGVWRFLALLPLFMVGFVVVRIVVDTQADPTSHNLWPFELVIWSFLAIAFLGVLVGVRSMFLQRSESETDTRRINSYLARVT